jgi:hydrogenase-4 component B
MVLFIVQTSVVTAFLASILALVLKRSPVVSKFLGFALLGVSGLTAIYAGISALIIKQIIIFQINTGLPNLNWTFKLDALSGFFLTVVGLIVLSVAVYGPSYMREYEQKQPIARMTFFTGIFIAAMYLVLLADDAFSFMFAWELMSLTSYFLVAYHHENSNNRSAAFIYLLMAQASGLFILCGYGVLITFGDGFSFSAMHAAHLSSFWATIAFICAFIGFGMKAGLIPLHVWLPQAHPVAPSHISALMSGVMLKIAVYGLLRFCFSLLGTLYWQWGVLILLIAVVSALFGVLYALMQHDLKKLLAYHSVENIGIIFIGIGLAFIFLTTGHEVLGALGLVAALYHCLNHALFKSLLFFGAGAIVQQSQEHDLEKMGGLIHKMPYTAWFFLIGCISISALPPFNGFVSEWLTFQTALQATILQSGILRILIPAAAALLALTGALAAACFVKVYGVTFLGQPRTQGLNQARDPNLGMLSSMGFLAALCLLFGIFPSLIIHILNVIPATIIGSEVVETNWLWLIPISSSTASYAPLIIFISIILLWSGSVWLLRLRYKPTKEERVKPWECGFGAINSRMQYSSTAFAMPIRRVFKGAWMVTERISKEKNNSINYFLSVEDWAWKYMYLPLEKFINATARVLARIQGGNVRIYLAYVFCTLIILLWVVS